MPQDLDPRAPSINWRRMMLVAGAAQSFHDGLCAPLHEEDLTVACFRAFPWVFSLRGYAQYPDARRASAKLAGSDGAIARGWLRRIPPSAPGERSLLVVTSTGLDEVYLALCDRGVQEAVSRSGLPGAMPLLRAFQRRSMAAKPPRSGPLRPVPAPSRRSPGGRQETEGERALRIAREVVHHPASRHPKGHQQRKPHLTVVPPPSGDHPIPQELQQRMEDIVRASSPYPPRRG